MKALEILNSIATADYNFMNKFNTEESLQDFFWEAMKELEALKNINNDFRLLKKENIRLKKQLSKDHDIECSCSFCKPVNELKEFKFTNCNDCKNKIDGVFQEICGNCKRFYGCYFEAKELKC